MPLLLDRLATRYGKFPHEILHFDIEDLQIDYICFEQGLMQDRKENQNKG